MALWLEVCLCICVCVCVSVCFVRCILYVACVCARGRACARECPQQKQCVYVRSMYSVNVCSSRSSVYVIYSLSPSPTHMRARSLCRTTTSSTCRKTSEQPKWTASLSSGATRAHTHTYFGVANNMCVLLHLNLKPKLGRWERYLCTVCVCKCVCKCVCVCVNVRVFVPKP